MSVDDFCQAGKSGWYVVTRGTQCVLVVAVGRGRVVGFVDSV